MSRKNINRKYKAPKTRRAITDKDYQTYLKQYDNFAKANAMKEPKMSKTEYLMFKRHLEKNLIESGNPELIAKAHKNMARYIASTSKAFSENQIDVFKNSLEKLKSSIKSLAPSNRTLEEKAFLSETNLIKEIKKSGAKAFDELFKKYQNTFEKYGFAPDGNQSAISAFAMAGS